MLSINLAAGKIPPICSCGCGEQTLRSKKTDKSTFRVEGHWSSFKKGHNSQRPFGYIGMPSIERSRQYYSRRIKGAALAIKKEVLSHYAKGDLKCACCGETGFSFLTLDHIKPILRRTTKQNLGGIVLYKQLRTASYPEGYQVLCFNCNCAKGARAVCPHQENASVN